MASNRFSFATLSFLAAGGAAIALAQCSSAVPIGVNMGTDGGDDAPGTSGSSGGASSSGAGSSGASSSSGAASSSGATSSGVGSSSGTGSSSGATSSSSGGGSCCPSGWPMITCTYPGGGPGYACHNPALGCASSDVCGQGCDTAHAGVCGGSSSGAGSSSGGSGLRWVTSCGPPVAQSDCTADGGLRDDAGAPCPALGSSCSTQGDLCGTPGPYACPIGEICSTGAPMACPISSRKHKDGIEYVDDKGLEQLHDETLKIQLATYNYKPEASDPAPRHLGFIIEDMPPATPAVGWSRERVDLYGYVSMVVATMQVQEKEIAELRRELAATRAGSCE